MNLTQRQLKIFITVAQSSSLQQAGKAVHMSQSGITRALQELESQLSCSLFVRTSKKSLKLTPQGEFFFRIAKKWIGEIEAVTNDLMRIGENSETCITVAAGSGFCGLLASDLINHLSKTVSTIQVKLIEAHSTAITKFIDLGRADFGIGTPIGFNEHYDITPLMTAPMGFLYLEDDLFEPANRFIKENPELADVSYDGSFNVLLVERTQENKRVVRSIAVSSLTTQISMTHAGHVSIMSALGASHPLAKKCHFSPVEPARHRHLSLFSRKTFVFPEYRPRLIACIDAAISENKKNIHSSVSVIL